MDTISNLDPSEYPELCKPRRKKIIVRLYKLMEHMLTYSTPVWPEKDKRYFLFSQKHLSDWYRANGGTGDETTWQAHKIFLLHTGLLKTFVVIGEHPDPVLKRNWERAKAKHHRTTTLWTVPLFTPDILRHAEEIARQYTQYHINISRIRKNIISRVWGKRTANYLYRSTGHNIGKNEWIVYACLVQAMKDCISQHGFTTENEITAEAQALCEDTTDISQQECKTLLRKLMAQKRYIIDHEGYEYHPIRNTDRIVDIPEGYTGYIITPK